MSKEESVKAQIVSEIHKPARKHFPRRSVFLKGIDDLWQADLVELIPYSRENKGYKYLLNVIDCFSKFAWLERLKSKTGNEVTEAFQRILLTNGRRICKNLQTDRGKEFYNQHFKNLMESYNINHYSTFSNMKCSIVERFNRTFLNMLYKHFSLSSSYEWIKIYPSLVHKYNNTKHRTIQRKPSSVKGKKIEKELLHLIFRKSPPQTTEKLKYSVEDKVRISKFRSVFHKGYRPQWTTEIFKISKARRTVPPCYYLEDSDGRPIEGCFYAEELQKVKFPDYYLVEKIISKKGNRAYVKWLGFDDSHNSWINKKELLI